MPSNQILDRIRQEIIESGRDTRYKLSAYEFVLNGLEFYLAHLGEKRHVTGQEFSTGLLLFAQRQFGPLALNVLNTWGITGTIDLGNIVYNLIDIGLMSKQPEDSLDHFYNVTDFCDFFREQDCYLIDRELIKRIKGA
jgi:uncharacterized repeat protein (TIGR04138 family)